MPNYLQPGDLVTFMGRRGSNRRIGLIVEIDPNWTWVQWSGNNIERHSFSVLRKIHPNENW